MKRLILTAVVFAIAAVLGGTTNLEASPHKVAAHVAPRGPVGHAPVVTHGRVVTPARIATHVAVAPRTHRTLVVRGRSLSVPIHVRGYRGWLSQCWFPGFCTYGYYSGANQAWYYWYAPFNQYLPITYMSIYPPAPMGVAPVGITPFGPQAPVGAPMPTALPPGASYVPGPINSPY